MTGDGGPGASETKAPDDARGDSDLTRSYVTVIVIQILVMAALYWFGRHFS